MRKVRYSHRTKNRVLKGILLISIHSSNYNKTTQPDNGFYLTNNPSGHHKGQRDGSSAPKPAPAHIDKGLERLIQKYRIESQNNLSSHRGGCQSARDLA